MNKSDISALLGRPLTTIEDTNFSLYLDIAKQNLGQMLCMELCGEDDPRVYEARDGYRTVFVDIFTDVHGVKLNGDVVTTFVKQQWDRKSGTWFNSLVFEDKLEKDDEVEVSASWGFDKYPTDLKVLLSELFSMITKKNKFDVTIASKQVEDFRISFNTTADLDESLIAKYKYTINKYSLCNISEVHNGSTGC